MHITDGVLSAPVLVGGAVIAAAGIAIGLRSIREDRLMPVALFSSVFFIASLIHLPGPVSVHLVLTGLLGVMLGFAAFPAIFVALLLQVFLLQIGSITTLGINTCVMAIPAVACYYLVRPLMLSDRKTFQTLGALIAGSGAVLCSAVLAALTLVLSGNLFLTAAASFLAIQVIVAVVEGIFTVAIVSFLRKVRPELIFCLSSSSAKQSEA